MEWVETTGRSIEEAKDAALDQLGVDEEEAEFEIVEEAKSGLFGRLRQEARVRARVRPTRPPPKVDRRGRRRGRREQPAGGEAPRAEKRSKPDRVEKHARVEKSENIEQGETRDTGEKEEQMTEELSIEEQRQLVHDFVEGLVDAFGADGSTSATITEEDDIEVQVEGQDLGLLIGPRGHTLEAVQELTRTVIQRHTVSHGRIRVDVGGYRQQRRAALERFTRQVAEEVRSSGVQKALEPMGAADRKVVHDTVNDIDGVASISEGEDPRRRVVIGPQTDAD